MINSLKIIIVKLVLLSKKPDYLPGFNRWRGYSFCKVTALLQVAGEKHGATAVLVRRPAEAKFCIEHYKRGITKA